MIAARLAGGNGRPMLAGAVDWLQRIADLLAERAGAYAAVSRHLDTSRLSVEAAAERVMGIAAGLPDGGYRMPRLDPGASRAIAPATRYDILIADGLLREAGQRIRAAGLPPGRCAVVTNPQIGGMPRGDAARFADATPGSSRRSTKSRKARRTRRWTPSPTSTTALPPTGLRGASR